MNKSFVEKLKELVAAKDAAEISSDEFTTQKGWLLQGRSQRAETLDVASADTSLT